MIACHKHRKDFTASIEYAFWNKTGLVAISFLLATSWFLILAKADRNGYVVACSPARCSAAEKNGLSGYRTVPCLAKVTEHSNTVNWIKFK